MELSSRVTLLPGGRQCYLEIALSLHSPPLHVCTDSWQRPNNPIALHGPGLLSRARKRGLVGPCLAQMEQAPVIADCPTTRRRASQPLLSFTRPSAQSTAVLKSPG